MNKIIHVNLSREEVQPILPHILALSIKEETLAIRRKIIHYCEGIALLHDNYKESWIGKPKYLGAIDIQMRWKEETPKANYKVTLIIDEGEKENEDTFKPYSHGEIPSVREEIPIGSAFRIIPDGSGI